MVSRKHWDPTEKPPEVKRFLTAAAGMRDSMRKLLDAWEKLEQDPELRDATMDALTNEYPFQRSFDEQYLWVVDWVHDLKEKL